MGENREWRGPIFIIEDPGLFPADYWSGVLKYGTVAAYE
jgi:hypothetical protein